MSIYIAIPTLKDNDLEDTLYWAFKKAKYHKDLYIGLAMMTDEEYYLKISNKFKNNQNITIKRFPPETNIGVGAGRKNAMSMYSNQDYIMQLDPHTLFEQDWDQKIIELYNESLIHTKNKKTILTAYLPAWFRVGEIVKSDSYSRYPFFRLMPEDNEHDHTNCLHSHIPSYIDVPVKESDLKKKIKKMKFLPSVRFCAHFAFTTKDFYKNTGLWEESIFFEEEIIQAINLLNDGYSLVFPNTNMPLFHMYTLPSNISGGIRTRQSTENLMNSSKEIFEKVSINFEKFIKNPENILKCEKYQKYTLMDKHFKPTKEYHIPTSYNL